MVQNSIFRPVLRRIKRLLDATVHSIIDRSPKCLPDMCRAYDAEADGLKIHFRSIRIGRRFRFIINLPHYKTTEISGKKMRINTENGPLLINVFGPENIKISVIGNTLIIRGVISVSPGECLVTESPFDIKEATPVMANVRPFPENYICGFVLKTGDSKYVIFNHTQKKQLYQGSDKIKQMVYSILKFQEDVLVGFWAK